MRILSLRLIVALIVGVTLVSLASSWYQVQAEKDALRHDLERKAETFGESLAGNAEAYLQAGDRPGLERMVRRFSNRDHLLGVGVYDQTFFPLAVTRDLNDLLPGTPPALADALASNRPETRYTRLQSKRLYLIAAPLHAVNKSVAGGMIIVYRRVWLSGEEEDGYYYGFANEGLWPLCHMAHTRPTFRAMDWEYYNHVNARFADAVVEEMAGEEHPLVLIQDYHFALLPRMLKDRMSHARVAIFWHIPWPNPEAFSICPWQQELLDGLLGADLIGFHVQAHCNNFLSTVDRVLEARVDWEHFSVKRKDHWSSVLPFPISVEFLEEAEDSARNDAAEARSALIAELGIEASLLGVARFNAMPIFNKKSRTRLTVSTSGSDVANGGRSSC